MKRNKTGQFVKLSKAAKIRSFIAKGGSVSEAAKKFGVSYHHAYSNVTYFDQHANKLERQEQVAS